MCMGSPAQNLAPLIKQVADQQGKVKKYDPSTAPKKKPKGKKAFTTDVGVTNNSEGSGLNIPT